MEKDFNNAEEAFRYSLKFNPQQKEALDGLRQLEKVRSEPEPRSKV
jgi:hypothetical protein